MKQETANLFTKRTVLYIICLIVFAIWLLRPKYSNADTFDPANPVDGIPHLEYAVPALENPNRPRVTVSRGNPFDWMNGVQCGCEGEDRTPLIITSVKLTGLEPGYQFIPNPNLSIPDALKGSPSLIQSPQMPAPIIYTPLKLTWWWDYLKDVNDDYRMILRASDGTLFREDKKQTYAINTIRPSEYSRGFFTDEIVWSGKSYEHDSTRDRKRLQSPKANGRKITPDMTI